jgi:hypothetical protein
MHSAKRRAHGGKKVSELKIKNFFALEGQHKIGQGNSLFKETPNDQ